MKYAVIIERAKSNFSAYVPDLPGCAVAGETKEETLELITAAINLHLEDLREKGETPRSPNSDIEIVEISAVSP